MEVEVVTLEDVYHVPSGRALPRSVGIPTAGTVEVEVVTLEDLYHVPLVVGSSSTSLSKLKVLKRVV